jgi:serpin B
MAQASKARRAPRSAFAAAPGLADWGARSALFGLLAVLGAAGHARAQDATAAMSEAGRSFARLSNDLGQALVSDLAAQSAGRTVLISPFGVASCLTLAAQGARGATAEGFSSGLGLKRNGLTLATSARAYADLSGDLGRPEAGRTLKVALSIWADQDVKLSPAFLETARSEFVASATSLDFGGDDAVERINRAVSSATDGKIPAMLSAPPPKGALALVDALYFKADWLEPFDAAKTRPAPFNRSDGDSRPTAMMHRKGDFDYFENDAFQAVALPYRDRRYELLVVLPRPHQSLSAEGFKQIDRTLFDERPGDLGLPRLHLSFVQDLLNALRRHGFGDALTSGADLSALSAEPTVIGQVLHAAVLDVDEAGSEGAAATGAISMRSAPVLRRPFSLVADRPFFLIIRERLSGTELFLAYVADPGLAADGPAQGGGGA